MSKSKSAFVLTGLACLLLAAIPLVMGMLETPVPEPQAGMLLVECYFDDSVTGHLQADACRDVAQMFEGPLKVDVIDVADHPELLTTNNEEGRLAPSEVPSVWISKVWNRVDGTELGSVHITETPQTKRQLIALIEREASTDYGSRDGQIQLKRIR